MRNSSNNSTVSVELGALRQYRGKALWTALATLVDGEGCICLAEEKKDKFNGSITVYNTCIPWMNAWAARTERGNIYAYEGRKEPQKSGAFWKMTRRADIVYILKKIRPYLFVKREQADLLISFYEDKLSTNKTWLGEKELSRRRAIYERMRVLNMRGPSESVETKCRTSEVEDVIVPAAETPAELSDNDLVN